MNCKIKQVAIACWTCNSAMQVQILAGDLLTKRSLLCKLPCRTCKKEQTCIELQEYLWKPISKYYYLIKVHLTKNKICCLCKIWCVYSLILLHLKYNIICYLSHNHAQIIAVIWLIPNRIRWVEIYSTKIYL